MTIPITMQRLDEVFESRALDELTAAYDAGKLLEWWRAHVTADLSDRAKYPGEIVSRFGPQALLETPRVVVGTIHSVKGGQADVVYLFPDLSQAGEAQYERGGQARDPVIRLFYVGATRAYERLYVCQRETISISI